jgi:hypothetical protein
MYLAEETLVPQLGEGFFDSLVQAAGGLVTAAPRLIAGKITTSQQSVSLKAQQDLAKQQAATAAAQANLIREQTLAQRTVAALKTPTGIGIGAGVLVAVGLGAYLLLKK